jgi:hypothetical protein
MKITKKQLMEIITEEIETSVKGDIPADALDVAGQVAADDVINKIYHKIFSTMETWIYSNERPIKDKDLPDLMVQIKIDTEILMLKLGRTMGEEPKLDEPDDLHHRALQDRGSYEELEEGKPDTTDTKSTEPKGASKAEKAEDTRRKRRAAKQGLKET